MKIYKPLQIYLLSSICAVMALSLDLNVVFAAGNSASNSDCYPVSGVIDFEGGAGSLVGYASGDLEGMVVNKGGAAIAHGVVVFRPVVQTWEVSGGIVDPLIGRTVIFENDSVGVFARPPIIIVNTKVRVFKGAQKGNLTLHGLTDLTDAPFYITSQLDYHGVICP